MNKVLRKYISIVGITVVLAIMIGLVWLGNELLSIHYRHQLDNNNWVAQEKYALNYLNNYLLSHDSTYYKKYRQKSRILHMSARWGKLIIDPSVDKDSVVNLLSSKSQQTAWQIRKSLFYDRTLSNFRAVDQTIQVWKTLISTLPRLDSLAASIHHSIRKNNTDSLSKAKFGERIINLRRDINQTESRLDSQFQKGSFWMQSLILKGTYVLAGILWLASIITIVAMNRLQRRSERKLREQKKQLRLNKEKFRELFDNTPLSIAYLDKKHHVVQINRSFEQLFGYKQKNINKHPLNNFITPPEKKEEAYKIDKQSIGGDPMSEETVRTDKDGNRINTIITTAPVIVNQELIGFFKIYTDITELIKTQNHLRNTIKDREVLIQEIHHRVKNNLAIISGLLFMQAEQVDSSDTFEHLHEALNRIQSMALVHEQLYQQTESDAYINMNQYLPKLVNSIRDTSTQHKDGISVNVDSEEIALPLTKAVPVGLLTTELIMNTFKHAFSKNEQGQIHVDLTEHDHEFKLLVSDNGCGLPEDFSLDNGSLGMNIITNLVEQIEGKIEIDSEPDEGTQFTITFVHD